MHRLSRSYHYVKKNVDGKADISEFIRPFQSKSTLSILNTIAVFRVFNILNISGLPYEFPSQ
jgi:hypothetical protein